MEEFNVDVAVAQIEADLAPRVQAAAEAFVSFVRPRLWRRTGITASKTRVVMRGTTAIVNFPWPSQYHELGTSHEPARPIVRPALVEFGPMLERIIAGEA